MIILLFLLTVLSASGAAPSTAPGLAEWTRFRGPNGSGIGSAAAAIPATWSDTDYNWKVALPGKGHSSPVLWGDRIFLTSSEANVARRMVLCLRAGDGVLLWRREFGSTTFPQNRDNSYASSTPAVDAQHAYIYWTTPEEITVLALDHDGKEVWRRHLGAFTSKHGSGTSPIVFEDVVVINNDQEGKSSLLALECQTGATRWQVERRTDCAAYSTPCVLRRENELAELIFTSSAHGISGIDPWTGKTKWELAEAFPERAVGSPIIASGLIVATCGEGGVGRRLVAVRPGSEKQPPQLVYEKKTPIPYVPTPLAKDGLLFLWGDNGLVACHRAATGERLWQEKFKDSFYSSPVWASGRLYGVSKNGVVYVLAAADLFKLFGSIPLGEPSFATPALANGVIYWRTESHLISLGARR